MRVAVLGATGAVGRTMLKVMEERRFPADEIVPLASERSAGARVPFNGQDWSVQAVARDSFDGCDIAFFSAGADLSREWAPIAAAAGAVVIDNSTAWRMHPRVPLVVPEINGVSASDRPLGIIANPNCAAIQLVVALAALRRRAQLRRVVVTTFQAVSGAGQPGLDALHAELEGGTSETSPFVGPIAGNVLPWIGQRLEDGWNEEEDKIRSETRKILDLPDLPVAATCVRVPVDTGHSVSAAVDLGTPLSPMDLRAAFESMPGMVFHDETHDPLPRDIAGTDSVYVGHVRSDRDLRGTVHLWIVADNLRKGAATNAVQIAELVTRTLAASHG